MKKITHQITTFLSKRSFFKKALEFLFKTECHLAQKWATASHKRLLYAQWAIPPAPEWFDHSIDLYYQWSTTNNSLWLERGIYSSLALKGGSTLELSSGDGFNTKHFYALRSKNVTAVDSDLSAIQTAKSKNSASNIEFVLADIRYNMPTGIFENIIWDAAIEHFTLDEIHSILRNIKLRLSQDGILSGYTIVERIDGIKHIHQHEYEFKSMQALNDFLSPYFKNVLVFETSYPSRHNLYFFASESTIPFDSKWTHYIY